MLFMNIVYPLHDKFTYNTITCLPIAFNLTAIKD